ncbi:ComEA family DNA-binding protein, partial [Nocardioides jensenii]|uniref:ComEA family DNA-binding protein n=1 Tax=Nocardioides jensenii TaxID=1843 RepID=UPI0009E6941F
PEPEPAGDPAGPPMLPIPGRHAARTATRPWLDLSAFRGRVALTAGQVAALAVLVAVGLAVTAWWVIRDDAGAPVAAPEGGPALATPVADGAPSSVASTGGSAASASELVVDVTGKVRHPGIVVLPPGSRVVDALKAAGGVRPGADLAGLNQARLITDGEQIVVGVPAPPGVAASSAPSPGATSGATVNLNSATTTELEELPGVGPVTAEAIVAWRDTNGGFRSVDQLLEVDGIGEKTLAELAPHVTL